MMEEVTVEQMNEAIALFDGYKPRFVKYPDSAHNRVEIWRNNHSVPLQYHSLWDWLMPCWFKAQYIGADIGISFKPFYNSFHAGIDHQNIGMSHKALFDFIQYRNQKNQ